MLHDPEKKYPDTSPITWVLFVLLAILMAAMLVYIELTRDQDLMSLAAGRVTETAVSASPTNTPTATIPPTNTPSPTPTATPTATALPSPLTVTPSWTWGAGASSDMVLSPAGDKLAISSALGVAVYMAADLERLRFLEMPSLTERVAFTPDGEAVATGSSDGVVRLWRLADGELEQSFTGHTGAIEALAANGRLLAAASADNTVRVWDRETGQEVWLFQEVQDTITSLLFSPDSQLLAAASHDSNIWLWALNSGEAQQLQQHTKPVLTLAFSPDGTRLASGAADKAVFVWEVASGDLKGILADHTGAVTAVTFSDNGRTVAAGGENGVVLFWELDERGNGRLSRSVNLAQGSILDLALTSNNTLLAARTGSGAIGFWQASTGQQILMLAD